MLISGDILAYELRENVVYQEIQEDSRLELASFQIWNASLTHIYREYLYVVLEPDWNAVKTLPRGTTVLYCGTVAEEELPVPEVNLIVLSGQNERDLINRLVLVFQKYTDLDERLTKAMESPAPLQEVVNIAATMIGVPVNMLDMNHNTLVYSTNLVPKGDILWDAMVEGYGYKHYTLVCRSIPSLAQMDTNGINLYQGRSNISGRYIRVYLLRLGTHGVASLGLHKHTACGQPFERHTVQLGNYVYDRLMQYVDHFPEIQKTRGNLFEQFLVDLLDNKITDQHQIEASETAGLMKINEWYVLGMVLFQECVPQTDYYLTLMDYLEANVPFCKCAVYKARLHFVCALPDGNRLTPEQERGVESFLEQYDCSCILSSPFKGLLELSRYKEMLWSVRGYIPPRCGTHEIWYFHQFAFQYALALLAEKLPLMAACHPALLQLRQYDRENESDYMETLREYLRNDCNVTKASNALHMHRNTLLYRINKIEKNILGMKLDENDLREELKFSFRCLEFQEREMPDLEGGA